MNKMIPMTSGKWSSWTTASRGVDFDDKLGYGSGRGESKVAAELDWTLSKKLEAFDLVDSSDDRWEVKELPKETDTFRPGRGGVILARQIMSEVDRLCRELTAFEGCLNHIEPMRTIEKQVPGLEDRYMDSIASFMFAEIDALSHGLELSQSAAFGGKGKVGVEAMLRAFRRLIGIVNANSELRSVQLDGRQKVMVPTSEFIRISAIINDHHFNKHSSIERAVAELTSPMFTDPLQFRRMWESIKPEAAFGYVKGLVVVNAELGYQKIMRSDLDTMLEFARITQGRVVLRVKRRQAPAGEAVAFVKETARRRSNRKRET